MEKHGYTMDRTVFMINRLLKDSAIRAKFNFQLVVLSKESNQERSLFCIIMLFARYDRLPLVARFDSFAFRHRTCIYRL